MDSTNKVSKTILASAITTVARLPRETVYGDFCLGRCGLDDRVKDPTWFFEDVRNVLHGIKLKGKKFVKRDDPDGNLLKIIPSKCTSERTEKQFAEHSHNKAHVELNKFVREGVFNFGKLPTEIRHHILRFATNPFYDDDVNLERAVVNFKIKLIDLGDISQYFAGDVNLFLWCNDEAYNPGGYEDSDDSSNDEYEYDTNKD